MKFDMERRKKFAPVVLLLVVLGVSAYLLASGRLNVFSAGNDGKETLLLGTVEATILPHYAQVSGKIIEAPLSLGQQVQAGDIVAVLDDSRERYNIEQLEATLARKQAVLAELLAGVEDTARRQADNNVRLAQQSLNLAQIDLERAQKDYADALLLQEQGATPEKTVSDAGYRVDTATEAVNAATTRLDTARQQAAQVAKGVAQEKIDAARADIELTESQLRQSKENLECYTVRASQAGTVISKNYHMGAMVNAGYNLADIASEEEKYLVAYLSEERLYDVNYGQALTMRGAGEEYQGTVAFIDLKAQFTPKENQTAANRNKSSYKIKILLPADAPWRPGEMVEVVL